MIYDGGRRKFTIFLLVVLIFICFIAGYGYLWRMWFVFAFSIGFLYLAGRCVSELDILFMDDELFVLEPDWDEWENMMKEEYLK